MRLLIEGGHSVGEIARRLPVSRPAVSKPLRVLEGADLAVMRAEGTRRIHAIDPATPEALRDEVDCVWRRAFSRYARVANNCPTVANARRKKRSSR